MLCVLFTLALILPSFAEEKGNPKEISTKCSDPEAVKVGDEFFKCFNVKVKNSIQLENKNCSLPRTIFDFVKVANETCYNDTKSRERDSLEFYKFMMFSMKNGNYKEFVEAGGVECIKAIKDKISRCVTGVVGNVKAANNKYHTLWKKTKLIIDVKSCTETNLIKMCTLKEMRSEGYYKCQYNNDNVLFVSSLFDFMLERCTRLKPMWVENGNNEWIPGKGQHGVLCKNGDSTTTIMLALFLTLAILGFLYVLFRECRRTDGCCKSFNEHFSMRYRRQSPVNEVDHENVP